MKNTLRETSVRAMRSLLALILAAGMLLTAMPEMASAASSVGTKPTDLSRSSYKAYVEPSSDITLFTSNEYSSTGAVTAPANSVLQLYTGDYYTIDSVDYCRIYYQNKLYNVRLADIKADIISPEDFELYLTGTYWKATSYPSLKEDDGLKGDYRAHAVQLALKTLGYTINVDGDYGTNTANVVEKFQQDNGLSKDGDAGPQTLGKLFPKAVEALSSSSTGVTKGDSPSKLTASAEKSYVKLPQETRLFLTDEYTTAGSKLVEKDTILQMYTLDYYTIGGVDYCRVYYNDTLYNVRRDDIASGIMNPADFKTFVTGTYWKSTSYPNLKSGDNLTHDYRVHAVQLALKTIGYTITVDGSYGSSMKAVVKQFQEDNSLVNDGDAGPQTLGKLFPKALAALPPESGSNVSGGGLGGGSGSGSGTVIPTTPSTTGTLRTIAKVNLRESRSTSALRLGSVPEGTVLTYYDMRVESDGTWYKVIYKNNTGWLLGTYVTTDLTSGSASNLLPSGSIRTTSKVNIRKETSVNSLRMGSIPENTIVSYSDTSVSNGITWYKVTYSKATGWIMGTYTSMYTANTTVSTNTLLPTGSIRTTAKVNLRETASTNGKRLGSVPENVILTYLDSGVADGVTWYKVNYKNNIGWIMGTFTSNYYAGGTTSTGTGTAPNSGTLKTTAKVNLRKKTSTTSTRLAQVPAGVNLSYTNTSVVGGVTWYYTSYAGQNGWLMGTYVSAKGNSNSAAIGTVTITKGGTRVRDAANGNKTGIVLSKGTTVDLIASPVTSGGYTWYNIRTSSGAVGFVRGDCASISSSGSTGGTGSVGGSNTTTTVYSNKLFAALPAGTILFKESTRPSSGYKTLHEDQILMLASDTTYIKNETEYISLYYRNQTYNTEFANVENYILDNSEMAVVLEALFEATLDETMKQSQDLVGDVRVYALQLGLQTLGLYTGNLDGNYGSGTTSAVRNLQRQAGLEVDGECGKNTWAALGARIGYININGGTTVAPETSTGSFGAVTSVQKLYWDFANKSTAEFPKYSYATVMDVKTKKVFTIYRWAGGSHADCVPATEADTKIMCEIVGFPYNSNRPSSSQKNLIINDDKNSNSTYTWPDFKNTWGGGIKVGGNWDRRPVLVNIGGKVYPASIYGWPHGYLGESSGVGSMKLGGKHVCEYNNYYGMMCVHFYDSTTHSGTSGSSSGHLEAVNEAWAYAKSVWPTLVK